MIGRGTRLWRDPQTGATKESFLIFDFWNNFPYFNMNPEGEIANPTEPLPVRLFRLRLDKLVLLRSVGQAAEVAATVRQLQAMVTQLPLDNINVRPHGEELQRLAEMAVWQDLDTTHLQHLRQTIAPLLRFLPDVNLAVMTFETRVERLATAFLSGETAEVSTVRTQIEEDLARLPPNLPEVQAQQGKLAWVRSDGFWQHLDYARIADLQSSLAPLLRYRLRRPQEIIKLHLPDQIAQRWIIYGPSGEGAFAANYQAQVEAQVRQLALQHPTLLKLQRGEPLADEDLHALAQTLNQADLFVTEATLRQTYNQPAATLVDFMRHILGLSRLTSREEEISAAFAAFIERHPQFTARQMTFLRVLRSQVLHQARLTAQDLDRPPFDRIGRVQQLFRADELAEMLAFAAHFDNSPKP
jgi:type I restriction enzyme R subunit